MKLFTINLSANIVFFISWFSIRNKPMSCFTVWKSLTWCKNLTQLTRYCTNLCIWRLDATYGIATTCPCSLSILLLSYLLNRSFYVKIDTSKSSAFQLPVGVPQRFVLSPLLFILYTHRRRSHGGSCPLPLLHGGRKMPCPCLFPCPCW